MSKCILISEAMSTGLVYINEVIDRGYQPIVVASRKPVVEKDEHYIEDRREYLEPYLDKIILIDEPENFDDLMKMLEPYDIECVVTGSENGVRLTDMLCKALNLPGNDPETTWRRCTKNGMHQSLKEAGIRYIKSAFVKNTDEIKKFWEENRLSSAVLKFNESAGSMGLKICRNIDDALTYFDEIGECWTKELAEVQDVLIQEYIGGTEYIVNSISYGGQHKVTDVWRYNKILSDTGNMVYDYAILETVPEPGTYELVNYAYKVLDAVDIRYGPCHMELKVDENGPVLIETNPRPMGAGMTKEFLDEALGHHITNIMLDIMINPIRFNNLKEMPYHPMQPTMLKILFVPYDVVGSLAPAIEMLKHLKSYRSFSVHYTLKKKEYRKTIDLFTSPLTIYLSNSDPLRLMMDNAFIDMLQFNFLDILYSSTEVLETTLTRTDISRLTAAVPVNKKYLIMENDRASIYQNGTVTKESYDNWDIYDGVILSISDAMPLKDRIHKIIMHTTQVRGGGKIVVTPETYEMIPHGVNFIEVLMALTEVTPELPKPDSDGVIIGTKV